MRAKPKKLPVVLFLSLAGTLIALSVISQSLRASATRTLATRQRVVVAPVTHQLQRNDRYFANKSAATPPANQQEKAERTRKEFQSRYPVIDYDASPEHESAEEKVKRPKRNKHYDERRLVTAHPYESTSSITVDDEDLALSALPVGQSDVILIADVLNSKAHLANKKRSVYSEFNVRVEEVLKGELLSKTSVISVSRLGGMVRYPSGQKVLYEIGNQNMPSSGKRYLFFLKSTAESDAFEIVTGYEMSSDRILPLDRGAKFEAYRNIDSMTFINKLRDEIAK